MAGGVALNCVANGKLLKSGIFDDIWVQPAAGDAGGALGAALAVWHEHLNNERFRTAATPCVAPTSARPMSRTDIERRLSALGANIPRHVGLRRDREYRGCAGQRNRQLAGCRAAWNSDRVRLAAARSWAIRARRPCRRVLNLKVKYRESFRPLRPSVRREDMGDWFDIDVDSPYMLMVGNVLGQQAAASPTSMKTSCSVSTS